jgi:hypothetical protein
MDSTPGISAGAISQIETLPLVLDYIEKLAIDLDS